MRSFPKATSVAELTRRSSILGLFLIVASCASTTKEEPTALGSAGPTPPGATTTMVAGPAGPAAPTAKAAPTQQRVAVATAPDSKVVVERLIDLGKHDNHVQQHLEHLTKSIGPRLTSSSNLKRAQDWAVAQFQSFGLEAHLEQWGEYPVGFDRGPWRGGMVAPEKMDFVFNTQAWAAGTHGAQRGPALKFPTTDAEFAAIEGKIAGAWLVRPPSNSLKDADGKVVFEKPEQPSREIIKKVEDAILEKGGLGELSGSRSDLLITDGRYNIKWEEIPKLVNIRVRKDHHDQLWQQMLKDAPVELEFDIDNKFVQGPIPQYNVVAELKGSTKPDEYVVVCGHLDSWDGAQGAVDNGTGCATTIEAARLLTAAGAKPERSIRFILWSGEEQGLFGSEGYVRDHKNELDKICAVLNHDEGTDYLSGLTITHQMEAPMTTVCEPLLGLEAEMPFKLDVADDLKSSPDSDHWPFVKAGVPAFFWHQAGGADYNHCHHTQYDTFDAAIPKYQEHSATVAAIAAFNCANLPALLDRANIAPVEPRRMNVEFNDQANGNKVTAVTAKGVADAAGWKEGDVVVSIDGVAVKGRREISSELQKGGSKKVVLIQRGEQQVETTLDYTDDLGEARRVEAAAKKAKRDAEKAAEKAKADAEKPKDDAGKPADKPAEKKEPAQKPAKLLSSKF
jgi:hypothetical protein